MLIHPSIEKDLEADIITKADFFSQQYSNKPFEQILFLLEAFYLFKNRKYIDSIKKIARKSYDYQSACPNNMSYINGGSGLIYIFLKVYQASGDEEYLQKAVSLIKSSGKYYLESNFVGDSLYIGRSGLLLILLYLYTITGDKELLDQIDLYSKKTISKAVSLKDGLAWFNPHQLVIQPLASFGYGAAGIGFVFRELGDYFNHVPFKTVAAKAFEYVNENCFDKKVNLWNDYRKEITNPEIFEQHFRHHCNHNNSFFNTPSIDYSIENGVAGIVYSQMRDIKALQAVKHIPNSDSLPNMVKFDQFHLYLELFSLYGSDIHKNKAKKILANCFHTKGTNPSGLDAGLLEISYLKGGSCSFKLPKLNADKPRHENSDVQFLRGCEIGSLLAENPYRKTLNYLSHLKSSSCNLPGPEETFETAEDYIDNQIKTVENSLLQREVLEDVFQYEQRLWVKKLQQKQNPYLHICEFVESKTRITALDITDKELLKRRLILSNKIQTDKTFFQIKDLSKIQKLPNRTDLFWKYDTEEGVSETPFNFLSVIIYRFKHSKVAETGLLEILLYCTLQNEKKIKPLIEHSGSKSKKFLLERIPYLFLSEVRFLIADGVLEFEKDESQPVCIKGNILKLFLKIVRLFTKT